MNKRIYSNNEVGRIILDESHITGIEWLNNKDGNPVNIEMGIDWNGQEDLSKEFDFMSIKTKLFFSLVIDAKFCFEFKNPYTIGRLEITDFSYDYDDNSQLYIIEFKFESIPVGYIKFYCVDFHFEIIEQ